MPICCVALPVAAAVTEGLDGWHTGIGLLALAVLLARRPEGRSWVAAFCNGGGRLPGVV